MGERKDLKIWLTTGGKNEVGSLSHTLIIRRILLMWGQRKFSLRKTKKHKYKKLIFFLHFRAAPMVYVSSARGQIGATAAGVESEL